MDCRKKLQNIGKGARFKSAIGVRTVVILVRVARKNNMSDCSTQAEASIMGKISLNRLKRVRQMRGTFEKNGLICIQKGYVIEML